MSTNKILVLNGPNLNLLGVREPDKYGVTTLDQINQTLNKQASSYKLGIEFYQSNSEGALVDRIQQLINNPVDFIIINPAAYTHTSVAIRDALLGVNAKFVEVHLSNIYKRENFRHKSYFSDIALGTICGLGNLGYSLALQYLIDTFYLPKE